MGSAIDLANIKADTLAHHSPCGLSPKLACVIVNQGSITLSNTLLKPGDLWVQPVMDLPLEVTSETDQVLFFIYYQHQSTIDHGTVELI